VWIRSTWKVLKCGAGEGWRSVKMIKEDRNIVHTINRRKANWIDPILRGNCLLKHIIEGKMEARI
jgi:hypothetical protein